MTRTEMEVEAGQLLAQRAADARLGLELPPDLLQRLKSLLLRLGWTNMKLRRRETLLKLARKIGVRRYARVTPDHLRLLAEAVSKNPNDEAIRHAYADAHEEAGNPGAAELARTGEIPTRNPVSPGLEVRRLVGVNGFKGRMPSRFEIVHYRPIQSNRGWVWRRSHSGHISNTLKRLRDNGYDYPIGGLHNQPLTDDEVSSHEAFVRDGVPVISKYDRKGQPLRKAKVDSHVQAHPLVQGFPIETALRHLANDPANHPSIRELAKVAVTGGKNQDASNVPTALWALHDALHEHNHPAKDWYNWMSAADKIGLDAHVGRAVDELHQDYRSRHGGNPDDLPWEQTLGGILNRAVSGTGTKPAYVGDDIAGHQAVRQRIHDRVAQLDPRATPDDMDESLLRHRYRTTTQWLRDQGVMSPEDEEEFRDRHTKPAYPVKGNEKLTKQVKATRYSRLLNKLRYALSEGRSSRHMSGEEMFTHDYNEGDSSGVARVIPRNDGRTLHVDYVGPHDASPGQTDKLNTLGAGKVRSLAAQLKEKYPNAKFLTGFRGSRKVVLPFKRKGEAKHYKMVAGDFLDALRRINSADQTGIKDTLETIAAKIGAKPASTVNALFDSPHVSIPGVAMASYANAKPEALQALAAWGGLTGNIPGMAVFHVRPDGPDFLHRFRTQGSGHELRNRLDKAGITERVVIPHRQGYDLLIPDKGGQMRQRIQDFAKQQKTELQTSRGHFKVTGSSDQAKAREMFRNAIVRSEQPAKKSEGGPAPTPPNPGPGTPQGPASGLGPGADVPARPVYRASRLRSMLNRLKRA